MHIRPARPEDALSISEIYNEYVLRTTISFETQPVDIEEMRQRICNMQIRFDWLVAERESQIIGYAYYGSFRERSAYEHTAESTIYMAPGSIGQGLGKQLYSVLIESARKKGLRELIGVIALPNAASVTLHEKLGFQTVGILKNVGKKFDTYVDVGLYQLSL